MITPKSTSARHVISVENISTLPYGVRISASLPSGMRRIAFLTARGTVPDWQDHHFNIPGKASVDLECRLLRVRGTTAGTEGLRCDTVWKNKGHLPFHPIARPPFQITMAVT